MGLNLQINDVLKDMCLNIEDSKVSKYRLNQLKKAYQKYGSHNYIFVYVYMGLLFIDVKPKKASLVIDKIFEYSFELVVSMNDEEIEERIIKPLFFELDDIRLVNDLLLKAFLIYQTYCNLCNIKFDESILNRLNKLYSRTIFTSRRYQMK